MRDVRENFIERTTKGDVSAWMKERSLSRNNGEPSSETLVEGGYAVKEDCQYMFAGQDRRHKTLFELRPHIFWGCVTD